MSLIKFTRGFRGVATREQYYEEGEIVDHPNAAAIVAEGAAEFVTPEVEMKTPLAPDVIDTLPELAPILAAKPVGRARAQRNSKG